MNTNKKAPKRVNAAGALNTTSLDGNPETQPQSIAGAAKPKAPLGGGLKQPRPAEIARTLYLHGQQRPIDNPFLTENGFKPGSLRELTAREVEEITGDSPTDEGGHPLIGRLLIALLVELSPEGKVMPSNVLFVDESGVQAMLSGDVKAGEFWPTTNLPEGDGDGERMHVAVGIVSALSARQSSGEFTVAALSPADLGPVAEALRAKYPKAEICIFDDDADDGIDGAVADEAGEQSGPNTSAEPPASDLNDSRESNMPEEDGRPVEAPHSADESASPIEGIADTVDRDTAKREIARLAKLDTFDYERERKAAANQIGMRPSVLDDCVRQARGKEKAGQGQDVLFEDVKPADDPVPLADLLNEVSALYSKHVIVPPHAADAAALWTVATWACEHTDNAPILLLRSPEPRCGKTTMLSLLTKTVHRPLSTANISPAAMFRMIEKESPTLLIDEGDAFLRGNEELRGVINAGHSRATAYVIRTVGDQYEPRRFNVYGFKALALIGKAPHTVTDRSIVINLRRKLPSESVAKLRYVPKAKFDALKRGLARWAVDHAHELAHARPKIPEALNDRASDSWQPLLAIGDMAGGDWPQRARAAAVALSGHAEETSLGVELLIDVRRVFEEKGVARIAGADLAEALVANPERPWANFKNGQPLTQAQLAAMLRQFDVVSSSVRLPDGQNLKGYKIEQFSDAFARYLPSTGVEAVTASQPNAGAGCDVSAERHSSDPVTA